MSKTSKKQTEDFANQQLTQLNQSNPKGVNRKKKENIDPKNSSLKFF